MSRKLKNSQARVNNLFSCCLVVILAPIVLAIVAVVVGMVLPSIQSARNP